MLMKAGTASLRCSGASGAATVAVLPMPLTLFMSIRAGMLLISVGTTKRKKFVSLVSLALFE